MKPLIGKKIIKQGFFKPEEIHIEFKIRLKRIKNNKKLYTINNGIDVVCKKYKVNPFTRKSTLVMETNHLYSKLGEESVYLIDLKNYKGIRVILKDIHNGKQRIIDIKPNEKCLK